MEPMTLGSPVHSPNHPPSFPSATNYHPTHAPSTPVGGMYDHAGGQHQGFLPGYLMGDQSFSQQTSSTPTGGRMLSPTKLNRSISQQQALTPQTPLQQRPNPQGFLTPNASQLRTPSDKQGGGGGPVVAGGPPTSSLYSSLSARHTPNRLNSTPAFGTPVPTTPQLSFGATPQPHQLQVGNVREEVLNQSDVFSTCQESSSNWVTVFGFPPSAAGYILSQFSQCGTILDRHIPPNGNWMHLKFQTKMQAEKALSKSNRVMGGSIMIGVSPCTDPNVEDIVDNNTSVLNQSAALGPSGLATSTPVPSNPRHPQHSVADQSVTTLNSSLAGGSFQQQLNRSIRPLAQAYKAANNENEILNRTQTPNKSNGIVGKAMGYIFGW